MRKIPSLFQRNYETDRLVRDEIVPGCEWVIEGEGVATVKVDGTACMIRDGNLYKRYDRKGGKPAPEGWEPCQPEPEAQGGSWPGWVPVGDGREDRWHREAFETDSDWTDGTYELIGPKVQGNSEGMERHWLMRHGALVLEDFPRTFDAIRDEIARLGIEGVVWHHEDGRRAKIKGKDFGIKRHQVAR